VACLDATPRGQDRVPFSVLQPKDFHKSAAESERLLNLQAGRGYRLVSLRDVQVWEPVTAERVPEYRVVVAPHTPQWLTRSNERKTKAALRDAVNALAQQGFRVHPDAHSPGAETFLRGGERGATIVMERVPGRSEACLYDVAGVENDDPIVLPREASPLPLRVWRGVLTESCNPPPDDRPGGLTLKWLDHREGRRLGGLFSAMADEGCRFLVDNVDAGKPELGSLVACAVGASTRRDYRLLVPQGNSAPLAPPEAAKQSVLQRELNAAGADGFCLVGSTSVQLVLERTTPRTERCEYRLAIAEGERLVAIVNQGLAQGFRPVTRVEWSGGTVLERRLAGAN
jgi:hypothetical protein